MKAYLVVAYVDTAWDACDPAAGHCDPGGPRLDTVRIFEDELEAKIYFGELNAPGNKYESIEIRDVEVKLRGE